MQNVLLGKINAFNGPRGCRVCRNWHLLQTKSFPPKRLACFLTEFNRTCWHVRSHGLQTHIAAACGANLQALEAIPTRLSCADLAYSMHLHLADSSIAVPALQLGEPGADLAKAFAAAFGGLFLLMVLGRAWLYSQQQYILAAMLSKYVKRGGARVVQLGGSTRELYYYPTDAECVTVVGPGLKPGLWQQAGIAAGLQVVAREGAVLDTLPKLPPTADVVVTFPGVLATAEELPQLLRECGRVLKPGGRLVFMQRVRGEGGVGVLQGLLGGAGAPDLSSLEAAFDALPDVGDLEADLALENLDPHVVGVVVMAAAAGQHERMDTARKAAQQREGAKKVRGFGSL